MKRKTSNFDHEGTQIEQFTDPQKYKKLEEKLAKAFENSMNNPEYRKSHNMRLAEN